MSLTGSLRRWSLRHRAVLVVTLLSTAAMSPGLLSEDRHFDEDDWLARGRLFHPWAAGRWRHPLWNSTAAIDHPLLVTHLFGLACGLGRRGEEELPPLRPEPRVGESIYRPAAGEAAWSAVLRARCVVATFGVLLCVGVFVSCRQMCGGVAGACAVGGLLLNPLVRSLSHRATGDVPVQGLILACLAALLIAANCVESGHVGRGGCWLAVAGLLGGLAASARLDGLVAPAALLACAVLLILVVPSEPRQTAAVVLGRRRAPIALGAASGLVLAALVFVLNNPPFATHPVQAARRTYAHRLWTVRVQSRLFDREHLTDARLRATAAVRYLGGQTGTLRSICRSPHAVWLDRAAALGGLVVLLRQAHRRTRPLAVLCWLIAGALWIGIVCSAVPFDWSRYFLGPVIYVTVLEGLSVGWLAGRLALGWPRRGSQGGPGDVCCRT